MNEELSQRAEPARREQPEKYFIEHNHQRLKGKGAQVQKHKSTLEIRLKHRLTQKVGAH